MTRKPYSAENAADLRKLWSDHRLSVIADLSLEERRSSASRWSLRHLIAYRLLVHPEKHFLETFDLDHRLACPLCPRSEASSSQRIRGDNIDNLLRHGQPDDLEAKESDLLISSPGGFLWVSLAQARHPDATEEDKWYPERERQPPTRPDYVDSSAAIQGSSSPTWPSSSEYDQGSQDIDDDENENRRWIPEDFAVRLATDFIRYILQLCLQQEGDLVEIRPRIERLRATAYLSGVDVTCEDDGGICKFQRVSPNRHWTATHRYLALIEGKRAFRQLHVDPRTGRSSPIVSDDTLAQYLAEAVITWKANRELLYKDIFLIAVSNTFIRFIHFKFGTEYAEYLDATETQQRVLVEDDTKDTYAYMSCTKWYNLQMTEGRKIAACHVLALLRWHDAQDSVRAESEGDIRERSSDYSMSSDFGDHSDS